MKQFFSVSAIFVVILVLLSTFADAKNETYFVKNGDGAIQAYGDLSKIDVEAWQYWLFARDITPMPILKHTWGVIEAKTIEDLNKKLKASQDFEKRYEKWCKCGPDRLTHFNNLGPIAVMRTDIPKAILDEISEAKEKYNSVKEIYDNIMAVVSPEIDENPNVKFPGSVLQEYAENLQDVFEKQKKLRDILDNLWLPEAQIEFALENINKEFDELMKKGKKTANDLPTKKSEGIVGDWVWNDEKVIIKKDKDYYKKEIFTISGTTIVIESVKENKITGRVKLFPQEDILGCNSRAGVNVYIAGNISKDDQEIRMRYESVIFESESRGIGHIAGCKVEPSGKFDEIVLKRAGTAK